jgi:hypothetical protein
MVRVMVQEGEEKKQECEVVENGTFFFVHRNVHEWLVWEMQGALW